METKLHIISIDSGNAIQLMFPNGTDCLDQYGFGLFLSDWKDGEVLVETEAKRIILEDGQEMDMGGIEFFDGKRIGFMQGVIPKDEISINGDSKNWIRELPELEYTEEAKDG